MSDDLSKYIYKDTESDTFYADIEDYTETGHHLQGYEDGDIVKWVWDSVRYIGTIRQYGCSSNGIFVIKDAKPI